MIKNLFLRAVNKIKIILLWFYYDYEGLIEKQRALFKEFNLDRDEASAIIEEKYSSYPQLKDLASEHHLLFAAISLKGGIESIMEIGTYSGSCTKLLSILFPDARILTYDLPDDDPNFGRTYDRDSEKKLAKFIRERDSLIKSCKNVKFIQKNSLGLFNINEKFDLIWVDGAHGYPVIAMDIINSLGCLSSNGRMFVDDVWIDRKRNDPNYRSIGAFESLTALRHAGLIQFSLIPKRIQFPHGKGHLKKYIALVEHSSKHD